MMRSMNAVNFVYAVYLKLRLMKYEQGEIEQFVRRWYVMSLLTGRHSGSFESQFDFDIKQITLRDFKEYLQGIENAELSDAFWNMALVQNLETASVNSPYLNIFLASQVASNNRGFLSSDITVRDLITHRGDLHHIFPRGYLKKNGLNRFRYNQIANFVYMQSEINIKIGDKAPNKYFDELQRQCNGGKAVYGNIKDMKALKENLAMNAIPTSIYEMTVDNFDDFLEERRVLMAQKIRDYYFSL